MVIAYDLDGPTFKTRVRAFLAWREERGLKGCVQTFYRTQSWEQATGAAGFDVTLSYRQFERENPHASRLELVPGAAEGIRRLQAVHDSHHVITARSEESRLEVISFLEQHVEPMKGYYFNSHHEKGLRMKECGALALVEDNLKEAYHALLSYPEAYVIMFPHYENASLPRHPRCIYTSFQNLMDPDMSEEDWFLITPGAWIEVGDVFQGILESSKGGVGCWR